MLIELQDTEWPFTYTDHDRQIARAIVYDETGFFYFVRAQREDDFAITTWFTGTIGITITCAG